MHSTIASNRLDFRRGYLAAQSRLATWPHRNAGFFAIFLAACIIAAQAASAQEVPQPDQPANPAQTTTVHGFVRNGSSGTPLARTLVRINGDATTGVLTDGDGHFEISDVPAGPQDFTVTKPGYLDAIEGSADSTAWNAHGYGHNVIVASEMGDVIFNMLPVNSITGQIQLSTGDVADGIQVTLFKRIVRDGRAVWEEISTARTNSEGMYRFGALADGQYMVHTEPMMDNDAPPQLVERGSSNNVVRQGFVSIFYPDARDVAGAAKIRLSGGEQAQANLTLPLEPFQTVTATVIIPGRRSGDDISTEVMDAQGRQLPYPTQYDSSAHTLQAMLPDGNYSLLATRLPNMLRIATARNDPTFTLPATDSNPITGEVDFAVAGRPVSNLRLPMAMSRISPVEVSEIHDPNSTSQPRQGDPRVVIMLSQTGGSMSGGIVNQYAEGPLPGPLESTGVAPGSYWVHTSIASNTLCEASFTSNGVDLAHTPLIINHTLTSASPLLLTLRDDCAKLTLSLPGSLGMTAGEERFFTVYVVPDFDSTVDIVPQTLRLSTGGRITISGLTPGNYHVYTFDHPLALEYRNPAVLQQYPSQPVALAPNADAQLTVQVPQP